MKCNMCLRLLEFHSKKLLIPLSHFVNCTCHVVANSMTIMRSLYKTISPEILLIAYRDDDKQVLISMFTSYNYHDTTLQSMCKDLTVIRWRWIDGYCQVFTHWHHLLPWWWSTQFWLMLPAGRSWRPWKVRPTGETHESKRKYYEQGKTENEEFHDVEAQGSESERKTVFPRETGICFWQMCHL